MIKQQLHKWKIPLLVPNAVKPITLRAAKLCLHVANSLLISNVKYMYVLAKAEWGMPSLQDLVEIG